MVNISACGGGELRGFQEKGWGGGYTCVWEEDGGGGVLLEGKGRWGGDGVGDVIQGRSCRQHPPPSRSSLCPSQLPVLAELM